MTSPKRIYLAGHISLITFVHNYVVSAYRIEWVNGLAMRQEYLTIHGGAHELDPRKEMNF